MREVLISIQPKWVEKIVSGEKTVEVRKTKPKLETPFKVYIYETLGKTKWCNTCKDPCERPYPNCACHEGWGKVIGEFVCDKIDKIFQCNSGWVQEHACISREEYFKYLGLPYNFHFDSKGAYAWHITDLVVYDEPRELSEFKRWVDRSKGQRYHEDKLYLQTPPQSWCYIEPRQTAD